MTKKKRVRTTTVQSRTVQSWNFPEGRLMKCVVTHLYDRGLRGKALLSAFVELVPPWKSYFAKPISDNAIVQRAYNARRYKNENPESNPRLKPYWQPAGVLVRQGRKLTKPNIISITRRCEPKKAGLKPKRRARSPNK